MKSQETPSPKHQKSAMAENTSNSDQLLRIGELAKLTTLSKSCINLWVMQGKFIPPITLSPTVKVWRLGDVLKWIESQKQFNS
jgi:predicted DNA-binding transcriptional regulator AlpA